MKCSQSIIEEAEMCVIKKILSETQVIVIKRTAYLLSDFQDNSDDTKLFLQS